MTRGKEDMAEIVMRLHDDINAAVAKRQRVVTEGCSRRRHPGGDHGGPGTVIRPPRCVLCELHR
jgi:hypothetical protein